jgi:selenocysteine-specific elongation factor
VLVDLALSRLFCRVISALRWLSILVGIFRYNIGMKTDLSRDFILGTAGHIDHGKTSLIKALTGVDTDRLPEEKKRGITIELGYAHLDLPPFRLGIVDVPGHEKFIRQMLAGATGMDLVMLIVAADDSIKQQTYEHLDILRLLNIAAGVIVITKVDLAETEWLDLVELEIRQLVEGSFLENAPIVRTSVRSGQGIEELKHALLQACHQRVQATSQAIESGSALPFRMAIDRAFSITGHGTVVTGSVLSGKATVGDQVEIAPSQIPARIRGLQNHDASVESVQAGQRAAINLAGVTLQDVERGHELASIGFLIPTERMLVRLQMLERATRSLKNRSRIRFHIGTADVMAIVRLLDTVELQPGESGFAQISLASPAVATWGQPFVLRRPSPMESIGGGRVIHPNPVQVKEISGDESKRLADLAGEDLMKRASAAAYFAETGNWISSDLIRTAGVTDHASVFQQLKDQGELSEVRLSPSQTTIVHRQSLSVIANRILVVLERMHRQNPLRFAHARQELVNQFAYLQYPQWLDLAIDLLKDRKQINANVHSISLAGFGPKLTKGQKQLMEQLIQQFKTKGLAAPSVSELQSSAAKNKENVQELLDLAAENGALAKISDDLYLHQDCVNEIRKKLELVLGRVGTMTASEIRQALDTTRKYAIPILEYFDSIGFTQRDGDLRRLSIEVYNRD